MAVSAKVADRISTGLRKYRAILTGAIQRDVSESDTVMIVTDMLADVMGYDKYQHVTGQYAVRGTFCDLAVRVDEDLRFLIEAKAVGIALKDGHVKQAIDYAANQGVEWVVLTNGAVWRVYKVHFGQPIEKILVCEVDVLNSNARGSEILEAFGSLSREGFSKGSMAELLQQKQLTSKFAVAAVLLDDPMVEQLRRELRRLSPGLKVDVDYLRALLLNEVIKRDLVDSEEAKAASAIVRKFQKAIARERKRAESAAPPPQGAVADPTTETIGDNAADSIGIPSEN